MKKLSNYDHATVIRILEWASHQGGPSLQDTNKRRMAVVLLRKLRKNERRMDQDI